MGTSLASGLNASKFYRLRAKAVTEVNDKNKLASLHLVQVFEYEVNTKGGEITNFQ